MATVIKSGEFVTRAISIRAGTIDTAARTVRAVLTTEDACRMFGVYETLLMSGLASPKQIPLLDSHARGSILDQIGSVKDIGTEVASAVGTLHFAATDRANAAWELVRAGHLTDVSVGYQILNWDTVPAGETRVISGKAYTAPGDDDLRVVSKWSLKELSVVPIGADPRAKLREGGAGKTRPASGKDGKGFGPMVEANRAPGYLKVKALLDAERTRQADIRSAAGSDIPADLVKRAIAERWTAAQASERFLKHIRGSYTTPVLGAVHNLADDLGTDLGRCWSIAHGGAVAKTSHDQQVAKTLGSWDMRRIAEHCIAQSGQPIPGKAELFSRAISTASFTNVLYEAFNKTFQLSLEQHPSTSAQWCAEREVKDFRTGYEVVLSEDNGVLPLLPRGGEFKHTAFSDSKESYYVSTYGETFVLDRETFINDDVGAFARIPASMARKGGRLPDDLVYSVLMSNSGQGPLLTEDSARLVATTRSPANRLTGGGSALSDSALETADVNLSLCRGLGASATDRPLGLKGKYLIVPRALAATAHKWTDTEEVLAGGFAATNAFSNFPIKNPWYRAFEPIVEGRLDAGTNGSTAWYLAADPNVAPTVVRVILKGNRTPTLERADPMNTLGIGWRVYFDAGAAAVGHRGLVRSEGT